MILFLVLEIILVWIICILFRVYQFHSFEGKKVRTRVRFRGTCYESVSSLPFGTSWLVLSRFAAKCGRAKGRIEKLNVRVYETRCCIDCFDLKTGKRNLWLYTIEWITIPCGTEWLDQMFIVRCGGHRWSCTTRYCVEITLHVNEETMQI